MQSLQSLRAPGGLHSHRRGFALNATTKSSATTTVVMRRTPTGSRSNRKDAKFWEQQVLDSLEGAKGRGKEGLGEEELEQLQEAVEVLEANGGIADPTSDPTLDGTWRLLYTSRPGTASPIQRSFTGVESFTILQEVELQGAEPRVNNVVDFGKFGFLKVQALASTDSNPLEGFTPRVDTGEFLFGLFGRSFNYSPARPNTRINFQFDQAAFQFSFLPFKIPYPVPFRLLKDEAKGWLDVTYCSEDRSFRLSRGNKGTLFILVKDVPLKQQLKKAIQEGDDAQVLTLVEALSQQSPISKPARSPAIGGTWRLVWSQQAENASALQKFGSKQANSFQIINLEDGTLENRVELGFVRIVASATCSIGSDTRTNVEVQDAGVSLGANGKPFGIPGARPRSDTPGWVDWLYLDEELRITRGSKGSLFIHYKEQA